MFKRLSTYYILLIFLDTLIMKRTIKVIILNYIMDSVIQADVTNEQLVAYRCQDDLMGIDSQYNTFLHRSIRLVL